MFTKSRHADTGNEYSHAPSPALPEAPVSGQETWSLRSAIRRFCSRSNVPRMSRSNTSHLVMEVALFRLAGEQITSTKRRSRRSKTDGLQPTPEHSPHCLRAEHSGLRVWGVAAQNHAHGARVTPALAGQSATVHFGDLARWLLLLDALSPGIRYLFLLCRGVIAAFRFK